MQEFVLTAVRPGIVLIIIALGYVRNVARKYRLLLPK